MQIMLRIFISILLQLLFLNQAYAQEAVEWFEPRHKNGNAPNTAIVTLVGKTQPGNIVKINQNSLLVIQYANKENSNFIPRSTLKPSVANAKGFFYVSVLVPFGLTQLTVELTTTAAETKPILITMRVDHESANLNVKVTRQAKIIKIKESSPRIFELLAGFSPLFQNDSSTSEKTTSFNYTSSSTLTPMFDLRAKLRYWKFNLHAGFAQMKIKNTITDQTLLQDTYAHQWIAVGSKYRWKEGSSICFASEVNWSNKSIYFINKFNEPKSSVLNTYQIGVGIEHEYNKPNYLVETELKYHMPFIVKIDKGEIIYNPNYVLTAASKLILKQNKNLDWGFGLSLANNNYNIQYRSSTDLVDTNDQKSQITYGLNLFLLYRWDKSLKSEQIKTD